MVLACLAARDADRQPPIRDLFERIHSGSTGRAAWRNVLCLCALARGAADRGDVDLAFEILDAIPEELRGAFFAPEMQRIRGELLLRRGARDEAEQCFRRAVEIAGSRAERSLELRAATSLGQLLVREGRRDEARRTVGGVHDWFTEGFETADLRAARGLLDQLRTR